MTRYAPQAYVVSIVDDDEAVRNALGNLLESVVFSVELYYSSALRKKPQMWRLGPSSEPANQMGCSLMSAEGFIRFSSESVLVPSTCH